MRADTRGLLYRPQPQSGAQGYIGGNHRSRRISGSRPERTEAAFVISRTSNSWLVPAARCKRVAFGRSGSIPSRCTKTRIRRNNSHAHVSAKETHRLYPPITRGCSSRVEQWPFNPTDWVQSPAPPPRSRSSVGRAVAS